MQQQRAAHHRLVHEPGCRALRRGEPLEPAALHDGEPHQFAALRGDLVEDRLDEAREPGAVQILLAEQRELERQPILVGARVLLYPALLAQLGQQAVGRAFGDVEARGDFRQPQPPRLGGEEFQCLQAPFEDALDNAHR